MCEDKYYKGTLTSHIGEELSYNADLLRVVSVDSDSDRTIVVLEPYKVDKKSIDELAKTVVKAEDLFIPIDPEDIPLMIVRGDVNDVDDSEFSQKAADLKAEPKNYTVLGVTLKYDKKIDGFITPDGEAYPERPYIKDLYEYVLEYKISLYTKALHAR